MHHNNIITTISFIAITDAILSDTVASQIIAAAVGSTYDQAAPENAVLESTESKQGKECPFVDVTLTQLDLVKAVDAGILRCGGNKEVCVEDASSSMGGRCAVVITNGGSSYAQGRRELLLSTPCTLASGQPGSKCSGGYACGGGTDISKIACGSCNGYSACYKMGVGSTVGEDSCNGSYATCSRTGVNTIIGAGSCNGQYACSFTGGSTLSYTGKSINVSNSSCNGDKACHKMGSYNSVGVGSCLGTDACYKTADKSTFGVGSCIGEFACKGNYFTFDIGDGLCTGEYKCQATTGKVH